MKTFEQKIADYLGERGWDDLRPGDIAKSIMIEGAELLEHFQWENLSKEEVLADEKKMIAIKKELADVMIYCFDMAAVLDIDVEQMLEEKLAKVKEKYPLEHFNHEQRGSREAVDTYWKIKEEHRMNGKN